MRDLFSIIHTKFPQQLWDFSLLIAIPFFFAFLAGALVETSHLLQQSLKPTVQYKNTEAKTGATPLHNAAPHGHLGIITNYYQTKTKA